MRPVSDLSLMPTTIFGAAPIQRGWTVRPCQESLVATNPFAAITWRPDQAGFPHAIVGGANLADPKVADLLNAQMKSPLLRGIRQQVRWHANPKYCFATRPDWVRGPAWRRGLAEGRDRGLVFELQVFPSQMQNAADLARGFPNLQIVLLHAGMLTDCEPGTLAAWRSGVQALAACPNVSSKLSALSTFARRCTADIWQPIVTEALNWFGADRCMFRSNFPVEKL